MELFHTEITPQAIELVTQTLQAAWVNEGPRVAQFEAALASQLGLSHPVALNSGTAALHLALALADVGPGDEVILPAQTFVATGLAVLMQRATPVFADIDPATGNLAPQAIREKITPRTRAILPVHWSGYPCDLDEIGQIAAQNGLVVIEDAAHALGATYKGQPIGAISRFTCFSFQAIKHLTTGDGGVLCCLDPADERQARCRRWFGIDRQAARSTSRSDRSFDIEVLGYKYHMNDLAASLGLGNLAAFPAQLTRRREIAAHYRQRLAGVPGLTLLRCDSDRQHAYWVFTILVDRRDDFTRCLKDRGVPTSVVDLRIDRFRVFGGQADDLPGQAEFDARQVAIPVHAALTADDVESIINAIRRGW